jgi:hypothetical protein
MNKKSKICSQQSNEYRLDNRSQRKFNKDILEATNHEKQLVSIWVKILSKERGKKINFRDNGCGNDGKPLGINEVSTDADFIVDEVGLVEVKFSKSLCKDFFHLKVNQVTSYLKQNATVLMVNGSNTENPTFIIINSDGLSRIKNSCKVVNFAGFGFKSSYKIPINDYIWKKFS